MREYNAAPQCATVGKRLLVWCLGFALLLSSALSLLAQPSDRARNETTDFSRVRKLIQEQMTARSVPSLAIAVARRGEILWEEGFGWADRENRIVATEHTPYYVASVTKTMTATALMILHERKQLDLDRSVNDYLGSTQVSSPRWNPTQATVRRVATHTAGLSTFDGNWPNSRPGMDETIRRYGVLFWPPGDHFDYSNLGYGILGEVVARVSGKSLADFLRIEVFWPLGMNQVSLGIGLGLEKSIAARYSSSGRSPQGEPSQSGASGVHCSAHDLLLFGLFHLKAHLPSQKAILSDASIDAMQKTTVDTGDGRYGLGGWWINEDFFGYRGLLAQGGTHDAHAWLQLIPSEGIAVVALSNTGDGFLPNTVIQEVLSVLLPSYRERRVRASADKPQSRIESKPPTSLIGEWVGAIKTYRGEVPLTFAMASDGDVHAKLGSQLTTLLNETRFSQKGLSGRFSGELGVEEDLGPPPNVLEFELSLRGETLYGAVTAYSRYGGRLCYWVELKKQRE